MSDAQQGVLRSNELYQGPRRRSRRLIVEFEDEYGNTRTVHRNPSGALAVARLGTTPILALTASLGQFIGERIRSERKARGWSLAYLAQRAGLVPASKQRMAEIEKGASGGIRLGTLYAVAAALEMESVLPLLPSVEHALFTAGIGSESIDALVVRR